MYAYPAGGSEGHDDVFAALCERYRPRLVAYCRRRLRTTHDAEDAAHEALLRAHRAFTACDTSRDPWPWLRTIASRVCTDILRRAARMAPMSLEGHVGDDVHEVVAGRLRVGIVEDALGQLPAHYRTPLVLREYGGWSYEEIARVQGKSLSSVRSVLSRSRRRLGSNVEAVARARGQWPLPGVVPSMRRVREQLRSWREVLERSAQATLTAIELSSIGSRLAIGAPAALAGMLGLSTAATAAAMTPSSVHVVPIERRGPLPLTPRQAQGELTVDASADPVATHVGVRATTPSRTFRGIDPTKPVPDDYNPLDTESTAGVADYDTRVQVEWDVRTRPPVGDEIVLDGHTETECTWDEQRAAVCSAVRGLAAQLPTH